MKKSEKIEALEIAVKYDIRTVQPKEEIKKGEEIILTISELGLQKLVSLKS